MGLDVAPIAVHLLLLSYTVSVIRAGILEQSMWARNQVWIGLLYRPATGGSIPWNRFLGFLNIFKKPSQYGTVHRDLLCSCIVRYASAKLMPNKKEGKRAFGDGCLQCWAQIRYSLPVTVISYKLLTQSYWRTSLGKLLVTHKLLL